MTHTADLKVVIEDRLRTKDNQLPGGAVPVFAEALAAEHRRLGPDPARVIDRSLTERGVIYPIHDSDLKWMDESAALAGAFWALTSNPIAVLGKLAALLYRLRRKRARLEGESALVLLALQDAPSRGWTVAELRDHLEQAQGVILSEEQVQALLHGLKNVRLSDNTCTDLADEHQGRWFTIDV
jgi:hypothetical protein